MSGYRRPIRERASNLRDAAVDMLSQEFDWSAGNLAVVLNSCAFAPSLLTFWLVNGVLDFSTALVIGAVQSPGGLVVRLIAYVLLVPVFLGVRMGYYLLHPEHRRAVLSGACPSSDVLSLDWFSVGILATGLPLALETLGPWIGMNAVFVVGLFVLPRFLAARRVKLTVKTTAIVGGSLLFLYASYGERVATATSLLPAPSRTLGWVATLTLSEATLQTLLDLINSVVLGPPLVAAIALGMNRLLTRPELTSMPLLRLSLPRRDPARIVLTSAALGTLFYLGVVALFTGRLVVLP
ncbi:MAG: hypothetical protein ABEH80_07405 [Halobaculum sp.]